MKRGCILYDGKESNIIDLTPKECFEEAFRQGAIVTGYLGIKIPFLAHKSDAELRDRADEKPYQNPNPPFKDLERYERIEQIKFGGKGIIISKISPFDRISTIAEIRERNPEYFLEEPLSPPEMRRIAEAIMHDERNFVNPWQENATKRYLINFFGGEGLSERQEQIEQRKDFQRRAPERPRGGGIIPDTHYGSGIRREKPGHPGNFRVR